MTFRIPFFVLTVIAIFSFVWAVDDSYEDGNVQISGTNDRCAEFCSKTYPAHTFDPSAAEQSCRQGCRLYSMIQFADKIKSSPPEASDDMANSTAIYAACDRECGDAYSDAIFKDACVDGCRHQEPIGSGQVRVVIDDSSPLFPFANRLINDAASKFDNFHNQMKTHLDNFRKWFRPDDLASPAVDADRKGNDDAKIVSSLQNMSDRLLKLFRELNLGGQTSSSTESGDQSPKPRLLGGPEDVADHLRNHGLNTTGKGAESSPKHAPGDEFAGSISVDNADEDDEPVIVVQMIPVNEDALSNSDGVASNERSPPPNPDVIYGDADDGWLACMARRMQNLSVLSRWMLCAALMLSMLCMMWLCLALIRNQQRRRHQHLYTKYRSGKNDAIYFTPPPAYEKAPPSAAYVPLHKQEKQAPASPPPSYKSAVERVTVKDETAKLETP